MKEEEVILGVRKAVEEEGFVEGEGFVEEDDAEQVMGQLGTNPGGIQVMAPKARFRLLRLNGIRCPMASILKQEMLSVGGDVAVAEWAVGCKKPETDVLMMGTLKHYKLVIEKMRGQVGDGPEIAERLAKFFEEF